MQNYSYISLLFHFFDLSGSKESKNSKILFAACGYHDLLERRFRIHANGYLSILYFLVSRFAGRIASYALCLLPVC